MAASEDDESEREEAGERATKRDAMTPAEAHVGVLDMYSKAGASIYNKATQSLYRDDANCFDCESEHLNGFLNKLEQRGMMYGWVESGVGILWIPKNVKEAIQDRHSDAFYDTVYLLENYGSISHEDIFTWEKSYINHVCRPAQDSLMMATCLMQSLTERGQQKVQIWKEDYEHKGRMCGLALLKVIIRETAIDTEATTMTIRQDLQNVKDYLVSLNSDITKVNLYVRTKLDALRARRANTKNMEEDLVVSLFTAYQRASDKEFCDYIKQIKNSHEDGTRTVNLTTLMQLAANKYKNLIQLEQWNAPSAQDEQIVALVSTTVAKMSQKAKKRKEGPKSASKGEKKSNKKPDWLFKQIPPPANQMKSTRTWNDQTYRWCSKETGGKCKGKDGKGAWRTHAANECEGDGNRQRSKSSKKGKSIKTEPGREGSKGKLKLSKSFQAMAASDDDSAST